ncbi:MAG: TolC family protein [Campylobacterota bacterium]|nr:TolC family protein [Campylobacterota bacterium]
MLKILIFLSIFYSSLFSTINDEIHRDIKNEFKDDINLWGLYIYKYPLNITFSKSHLIFQNNTHHIKPSYKLILKDFFPRYIDIIIKYKSMIKNIDIKVYSSKENSKGSTPEEKFNRNLILTQDTADEIYYFLENIKNDNILKNEEWLKNNIKHIGMSSSEALYNTNDEKKIPPSKRIEFTIELFEQYIEKSDNITKYTQIKEVKKDILVYDYIKEMFFNHPTLNKQRFLLGSLKKDIDIAKTAFNPTISLNYTDTFYAQSSSDDKRRSRDKDITLRYNIFNKFKDEQEENIRETFYKTSVYTQQQIELDIIYSMIEVFLDIKKQKEILAISKENLNEYDKWLKKEDIKFQNGLTSLTDYSQTKARYITQKMNFQELIRSNSDYISVFNKHIKLDIKDIDYFEDIDIQHNYFNNKSLALKDLPKSSPYIKESISNIDLYNKKVKKAKVSFYPTVDLVAKGRDVYNQYNNSRSSINESSIALQLKLDLYSGGADKDDYNKKVYEYKQKMEKSQEVIRDNILKVEYAFNKYFLTTKKNILLKKLIQERETSLIAAKYDYSFAKIDATGLLDAVDDLYNAKKLFIENRYSIIQSKYKILADMGLLKDIILK